MTVATVRAFLAEAAPDIAVIEAEHETASVAEAARGFNVPEDRIAKTLALRIGERRLLVVARGDARLDNAKARAAFGGKARMLDPDEVETLTGHPVGGVCPLGLATPLEVFCDVSLRRFDEIWPAAGSRNSAIRIAPERLATLAGATWIDVCAARPSASSL